LQQPALPTIHASPPRSLITLIAALAAGFALMLFVFIRQALRNASQDAESAQKLSAIQSAWRQALGR
jgi:uncharacterized protein involved in exopolysaccharide biosynthesis